MRKITLLISLLIMVVINGCVEKTMNQTVVKYLQDSPYSLSQSEIDSLFDNLKLTDNAIACVNWEDRNGDYSPLASFRIFYTDYALYIKYYVEEKEIRATFSEDKESKPWTDDCMELFIIPNSSNHVYYNIEMNCIGRGIVGFGAEKKDRERFTPEQMERIKRYSTLGEVPFGDKTLDANSAKTFKWSMMLEIPLDLICNGLGVELIKGKDVRANVYKCGDDMQNRHYLSWSPIKTEKPNFHTPEFFGIFKFE